MKEADLAIVGAGPGRLASAIKAARAGAKVVLLDENPAPGGQIYRRRHDSIEVLGSGSLGPDLKRGQKLLAEFDTIRRSVDYIENAFVWGIFDDNGVERRSRAHGAGVARARRVPQPRYVECARR